VAEILLFVAGYLSGSIPWGYILCMLFTGKDVRKHGSGNIGATNVYRVAGAPVALSVFILDMLKGFLPVYFATHFFGFNPFQAILTGLLSVIGHNFSIFLRGRGGKGVATSFGVISGLFPMPALMSLMVWIAVFLATRYVSAGSICASLALPLFIRLFDKTPAYTVSGIIICGLILFSHRGNIKRIINGTENKVTMKWQKK